MTIERVTLLERRKDERQCWFPYGEEEVVLKCARLTLMSLVLSSSGTSLQCRY